MSLNCNVPFSSHSGGPLLSDITNELRSAVSRCPVVVVRPGNHITKPFNLTSNQILFLEYGSVLFGSTNFSDYPIIEPLSTYGRSRDTQSKPPETLLRYQPLVLAYQQANVTISGPGVIDGQGSAWWPPVTFHYGRPGLVEFFKCRNVTVEGVTLRNSPFWTVHLALSDNVIVRGITVENPTTVRNTDGIDPDSSSNVDISDCTITCGDDGIAIKSGWDYPGVMAGIPSTNITIRNMVFHSENGISIGSEMSGGVSNVYVSNVTIATQGSALYIKTGPTRGGYVQNITYDGVSITTSNAAVMINRSYSEANPSNPLDWKPMPSMVHDVTYRNIAASGTAFAGDLVGTADALFYNVVMENVAIDSVEGWGRCEYVKGSATNVFPMPPCL